MSFAQFYSEFRDAMTLGPVQRLEKYLSEMDVESAIAKAERTNEIELLGGVVLAPLAGGAGCAIAYGIHCLSPYL